MREPPEATLRKIARRHKPRGWRVIEVGDPTPPRVDDLHLFLNKIIGLCHFDERTIITLPIINRWGLYVFLHECGHANQQKPSCFDAEPLWQIEYEAEQYAIKAMRGAGIPVPRAALASARRYVAACIETSPMAPTPEVAAFAKFV